MIDFIEKYIPAEVWDKIPETQQEEFLTWCKACEEYYAGDSDFMSDAEFDELQENLLNHNIPAINRIIKSGIFTNEGFETKHEYTQEMISLKKIKAEDYITPVWEVIRFLTQNKVDKNKEYPKFYISPKFDGCALKITFENREIKSIITRGGIDVTDIFKEMPSITYLKSINKPIVCGELLITKENFNKYYSSENGGDYENPRNFVGSIVKRSKSNITPEMISHLVFVPCTDGINPLLNPPASVWKVFPANEYLKFRGKLEEYYQKLKTDDYPFLCDGVVIGYCEPSNTRRVKGNYPLNMIAVKFKAPTAEAEVIGIDWTQKKSGKLTPRLILNPVKLDGSTITYTNGYNFERLVDDGIGIGSIVVITKSGDIIPVIKKVLKKSKTIEYPKCEYNRKGKHLIAVNLLETKIFKFVSALKILQLQGIGDVISKKLGEVVDYNIINLLNPDNKPDIANALGGGENWNKFSEIYNIKSLYLDEVINMLQFDNVGDKISKKIALLILKKSIDVANIPTSVLTNVCRGEGFKKITDTVKTLKSYGINVLPPVDINEETITYEMSGNPTGMTKSEFEKILKLKYPNSIHTSLTKNTKYLFVSDTSQNTSKVLKARKYNIKIVTYQDALNQKI